MTKRIISLFVVAIMTFALAFSANAQILLSSQGGFIQIADGVSLTLPEGYSAGSITPDGLSTNPGNPLLLWTSDFAEQIELHAYEADFNDFSSMTDSELNALGEALMQSGAVRGINAYEVITLGSGKFIKLSYDEAGTSYLFEYITVANGTRIDLKWYKDSTVTSGTEILIPNLSFPTSDTAFTATKSFTYTADKMSNVSFTVPDNWFTVSDELSDNGYMLSAVFGSNMNNGVTVTYSCYDMYSRQMLYSSEISRQEYTNQLDIKSEIKARFVYDDKNLTSEMSNGVMYGKLKTDNEFVSPDLGISIKTQDTHMISFSDGYFHIFTLSGIGCDDFYSDFRIFVETASYPTETANLNRFIPKVSVSESGNTSQPTDNDSQQPQAPSDSGNDSLILILILAGVVFAAIIVILILLLALKKNKSDNRITIIHNVAPGANAPGYPNSQLGENNPENAEPEGENIFNVSANMQNNNNVIYCRNCGGIVNLTIHKLCPHCNKPPIPNGEAPKEPQEGEAPEDNQQ